MIFLSHRTVGDGELVDHWCGCRFIEMLRAGLELSKEYHGESRFLPFGWHLFSFNLIRLLGLRSGLRPTCGSRDEAGAGSNSGFAGGSRAGTGISCVPPTLPRGPHDQRLSGHPDDRSGSEDLRRACAKTTQWTKAEREENFSHYDKCARSNPR